LTGKVTIFMLAVLTTVLSFSPSCSVQQQHAARLTSARLVMSAAPSTRREALRLACGTASALSAATVASYPLPAFAKGKKDALVLNEQIVGILRVKESCGQETRLISTGKYKELQRLNIKRAIRMMVDNSSLQDRMVTATAFISMDDQTKANNYARSAIEGLVQILEYFPQDLTVNQMSSEQNAFVLKALASTSNSIDGFLTLLPQEAVAKAVAQIEEENLLNLQEYPKDETILNLPA